jgi:hypothetical protein
MPFSDPTQSPHWLLGLPTVLLVGLSLSLIACGDDSPADSDTACATATCADAASDADLADVPPDAAQDTADAAPDGADATDATQDAIDAPTDAADAADLADVAADTAPDVATDVYPDLFDGPPGPYPAPNSWTPNRGPGVPPVTFLDEDLYAPCTFLDGGAQDIADHHNLVTMYDGYLLMPWAPEWSGGGLTFWDLTDPCAPATIGTGYSQYMRETHSIGFSHIGGAWAVVNGMRGVFDGGIQFWDISDPAAPTAVSNLDFEGFFYPDAYARVTLSVFWQAPYVYVAHADLGVQIVDATYPRHPRHVATYTFDPILRAGQIQAIGNLLVVTAAEGARTALLDISDPDAPQPIPGGDFLATDADGTPRDAYFTNTAGGFVYYARKDSGGGVVIWDIHDPSAPAYSGDVHSADGNGGYVFVHDHYAFTGESHFGAIYDISDHADIHEVARLNLDGDLDTLTPIGHLAVISVDDDATQNEGSAIAPWLTTPDTTAPHVTWSWPDDGATGLALTSRVGLTFNEFVDPRSAFDGSVRLYETGTDPDTTRVRGFVSAQEAIVNFWPAAPLEPGTDYTLEVPAGGITDFSGNAVATPFSMSFRTAGGR